MELMELIAGIIITCGVVYIVASWLSKEAKSLSARSISDILKKIEDFNPSQIYLNGKGNAAIAIDDEKGKLCLIYGIANIENPVVVESEQKIQIYNFADILETHILENGIIRAENTEQKIKKLELKVVVDDEKKTVHLINFMDVDRPVEKNNAIYKNAHENIIYWQDLINGFIKDNRDYTDKEQENKNTGDNYVADEIMKLAQLLQEGYITQEEFDLQKIKLLS